MSNTRLDPEALSAYLADRGLAVVPAAPKLKGPTIQMPVTVQPGVAALLALVKADEGFAVDLKRGIVSEVVRQLMPKSLDDFILDLVRREVDRVRSDLLLAGREAKNIDEIAKVEVGKVIDGIRRDSWTSRLPETSDAHRQMVEAVRGRLESVARAAVEETLGAGSEITGSSSPLKRAIEARVATMEERINGALSDKIEKAVTSRIDDAFAAEIDRRVEERIAKIRAAL